MGGAMPECRNCPVSNITWQQATEFVKKLSAQTGLKYRLPRVDEWVYAAQGAARILLKPSLVVVIILMKWPGPFITPKRTFILSLKKSPNELGIYDMTGNVSEWTNNILTSRPELQRAGRGLMTQLTVPSRLTKSSM